MAASRHHPPLSFILSSLGFPGVCYACFSLAHSSPFSSFPVFFLVEDCVSPASSFPVLFLVCGFCLNLLFLGPPAS